jgi:hypothetical protein
MLPAGRRTLDESLPPGVGSEKGVDSSIATAAAGWPGGRSLAPTRLPSFDTDSPVSPSLPHAARQDRRGRPRASVVLLLLTCLVS